jgi:hypothetical protein
MIFDGIQSDEYIEPPSMPAVTGVAAGRSAVAVPGGDIPL